MTQKQNLRAKTTFEKMVANGGKRRSLAQAMRDAGYSESYARNPQKIKKTEAWKEYLDEFIPDEKIALVHLSLLEAQRICRIAFPVCLTNNDIENIISSSGRKVVTIRRYRNRVSVAFSEPDVLAQIKALDLAYKIKGSYGKEDDTNLRPYSHLSDKQLATLIKRHKTPNLK